MPRSILVVDDECSITDSVADALYEEGYDVRRAYDGQEAFALAAEEPPDLLLADVRMPTLDGVALVERLRREGHACAVVLMSANYADVDLPRVRFVPKPFDLDHLLGVIRLALREA